MTLRRQFEIQFPNIGNTNSLRGLALRISGYAYAQARQACFFSATPPPCNFLANGETSNYSPPSPPIQCPLNLAQWKFPGRPVNCCIERGFAENTEEAPTLGLSLLFDPLVDAALAAHTQILAGHFRLPHGAKLIVLSDYGAIWDREIKLMGYNGPDWGEHETNEILCPVMPSGKVQLTQGEVGKTLFKLWNCLCPTWSKDPESLSQALQNVLFWNFMPFLRGSSGSSSEAELPDPKCGDWRKICMDWLGDFVEYTNPRRIVFCVNKEKILSIRSGGKAPVDWPTWKKAFPYQTHASIAARLDSNDVFVLNHPSSKAFSQNGDCQTLAAI